MLLSHHSPTQHGGRIKCGFVVAGQLSVLLLLATGICAVQDMMGIAGYCCLALLCLMPVCLAATSCKPDCYGHAQGDKVADPYNCYRYYYCLQTGSPSDASVGCPEDKPVFDPLIADCSNMAECMNPCVKPCNKPCNSTLDMVANPLDCNKYHLCAPGTVSDPFSCPGDVPYFDGEKCVPNKDVCCDSNDICHSLCVSEGVEIIDPRDCTKFYVCTKPGVPNPENHFSCGAGEVFDIFWGRCSPDAFCYTLCYD